MQYTCTKFLLILALTFLALTSGKVLTAQVNFLDISTPAGFDNTGSNRGVAIGDYDNDGDDDVYVSIHDAPNILYRNNGDGTYTDEAFLYGVAHDGITHASAWGDFDNDGNLDLYLGNRDTPNILYRNNGDGSFSDITLAAGVGALGKPRSVLLADVDRDGYLDIYVANLSAENVLYRNNGDLTFTDIAVSSGVTDPQISMGAMFFDYDNDGDSDLYLTHDGNQPYILYQNDGSGNFTDVSVASGTNYAGQGMGVDFGDINNDGWLDIYITNLSYNTLFLNNGDGTFSDISTEAMITNQGMGWGTTFLDYDNDGLQDIYMVNDSYFTPHPNILYRNKGDNTFEITSTNSPLASMSASYGTACTDINNDGLVDVFVVNNGNDGNQLFRNETADAGNWFRMKLQGTISNRSAIGTKVSLEAGGQIFTDEVSGGSGYASQNSLTLHFGLGAIEIIDKATIHWTNGLVETYENLAVNESMIAIENESMSVGLYPTESPDFQITTFPNPVSSELNILLENETSQYFDIFITDLMGRKIDQVFAGQIAQGTHTLTWDSARINTGVYLLTFQSEHFATTKKVLLTK